MAEAVAQKAFGAGLPTSPKPPTSFGAGLPTSPKPPPSFGAGLPTSPKPPTEGLPAPRFPLPGSCPTGVAY